MCGISGFYAPRRGSVGPWFGTATRAALHRGPDDEGYWSLRDPVVGRVTEFQREEPTRVAFGHLRLSIIDLSRGGQQPFVGAQGTILVFNGEIYNYLELRRELEHVGATFTTATDTEVIVRGFEQWGMNLFSKLNGMWAIALWDAQNETLILSRDRLGEKPLFVMPWRDGFAFASEVKQLRLFPDCQLTPNFEHLDRFASTGRPYSGSEHTFFENVSQVEPGTALLISESGSRTLTYFSLRSMMDVHSKSSVDELVDAAASALARSVEIRLRADVPVGVCLSSGIDSTAIVRTMAAFGSMTNRLAVTFDASVSTRSEAPIAKRTASHVGLSWARVQGSRDEYDSIRTRLLWHHETPIPDSSLYAQWSVFQEARRRGIVVMLDGQGADELFGGYLKLLVSHTKQSLARNPLHGLVALSGLIRHLLAAPPRRSTFARFSPFQHVRGPGNSSGNPRNPPMENEAHMRLADLTTWSLPNLLAWEDRNSMAHSLEARLPFLDPELLAIGLSAQPEFLYHKGWTKFPLRSVVSGLGEPEIAWRRAKLQFESPEIGWMAERAKTDTHLLSPYWSSAQLGPATQDLKRLAAAGHLSAFKKLRAIDDFLVLFWPS